MARSCLRLHWQRVIFPLAAIFAVVLGGPFTTAVASVQNEAAPRHLVSAQQADPPDVTASAAIVVDSATGRILYAKNDRAQLPEASTTKIMTALLTLELSRLDDVAKIVPEDLVGESTMGLVAGESISVEMLLYGMMLPSGNDAAMALARHVGESLPNAPGKDGVERFVNLMNARAAQMGLVDTHFTNPHGLDDDSHYTSARDLATMAWYALQNPKFNEIVSTRYREGSGHILYQANKLLDTYPGADGVKTGFTGDAGLCLVFSATRDGHRLIGVVLNAPQWYSDAARMLDFGFSVLAASPASQPAQSGSSASPRLALLISAMANPSGLLADLQNHYSGISKDHIGIPNGNGLVGSHPLQSLAGTLRVSLLESQPGQAAAPLPYGGTRLSDQKGNGAGLPPDSSQGPSQISNTTAEPAQAVGQSGLNFYHFLLAGSIVAILAAWLTKGKWLETTQAHFRGKRGNAAAGENTIASVVPERGAPPSSTQGADLGITARRAIALAAEGRHRAAMDHFVAVICIDPKYDFGEIEGFNELPARGFTALAAAYTACGRADYAGILLSWAADRFPGEIQPLLERPTPKGSRNTREISSSLPARGVSAGPGPRSDARARG